MGLQRQGLLHARCFARQLLPGDRHIHELQQHFRSADRRGLPSRSRQGRQRHICPHRPLRDRSGGRLLGLRGGRHQREVRLGRRLRQRRKYHGRERRRQDLCGDPSQRSLGRPLRFRQSRLLGLGRRSCQPLSRLAVQRQDEASRDRRILELRFLESFLRGNRI